MGFRRVILIDYFSSDRRGIGWQIENCFEGLGIVGAVIAVILAKTVCRKNKIFQIIFRI